MRKFCWCLTHNWVRDPEAEDRINDGSLIGNMKVYRCTHCTKAFVRPPRTVL